MYLLTIGLLVFCFKFCAWFFLSVFGGLAWSVKAICSGSQRRRKQKAALRIAAGREELKRAQQIEKQQREAERREREKQRFKWEQEKMEWARQKEADRRCELEYKKQQREEAKQDGKQEEKRKQAARIAKIDLDYCDQALTDLTPLVDMYREQFENTVTEKTKEKAYKKLVKLEAAQNRLDKQRLKAIHTIQGGA